MYHRPFSISLASLLFFQAAASEWPVRTTATSTASQICKATSLAPPSEELSMPPAPYFNGAARLSSVLAATSSTSKDAHQHVGVIVGACLGAAGGILLLGLALFWVLLRHRHHTATAHTQDVVPRSWLPSDLLGAHGVVAVANHPSLSLDLAGADTDNVSVMPVSDETAEMKRWNKSTDVLDISVENVPRSPPPSPPSPPLPEPIEPYVPSQVSHCAPSLSIHTDVQAEWSSPPSSLESSTPAGASRSPVRPLPTPPSRTRSQMRRPPSSAKSDEARRESRPSRLSRVVSADDLQVYVHDVHDRRRSAARSMSSISCEAVGREIVQHHDGGVDVEARINLPPPYYECLRDRATPPSTTSRAVAFPNG